MAPVAMQQFRRDIAKKCNAAFFAAPSPDFGSDPFVAIVRRDPAAGSRMIQTISLCNATAGFVASVACFLFTTMYWERCGCFNRPVRWWLLGYALLQMLMLPVRAVLFHSLQAAAETGQSVERCVMSIVAAQAWRASLLVGQVVYGWLVLGTVWWWQIGSCPSCQGMSLMMSWVLLLSAVRAVAVCVVQRVFRPAPALGRRRRRSSVPEGGIAEVLAASAEQINALPLVTFSAATCSDGFCSCCSVCLADFEEADSVRRLPCGHDFHQGCIDIWLCRNKRCPLCMRAVDDNLGDRPKVA